MAQMKIYTHEEMLDKVLGENGTPRRNQYVSDMSVFLTGEAIKKDRSSENLTQGQLGELIGVRRAQASLPGEFLDL